MSRKLYAKECGEAIRAYIWEQLKVELGLQRCICADYLTFPQDNPTANLPAVLVVFEDVDLKLGPELASVSTPYPYLVHFLEALTFADEPQPKVTAGAQRIAELFLQGDYRSPTILHDGLVIKSITSIAFGNLDGEPLQEFELMIGHGFCRVLVDAESHPIPL